VGFLFACCRADGTKTKHAMNATRTNNDTDIGGEEPAFERLTELYEYLGLATDHATAAANADLACGWYPAEILGTAE
jgi:hypothetical protein